MAEHVHSWVVRLNARPHHDATPVWIKELEPDDPIGVICTRCGQLELLASAVQFVPHRKIT